MHDSSIFHGTASWVVRLGYGKVEAPYEVDELCEHQFLAMENEVVKLGLQSLQQCSG